MPRRGLVLLSLLIASILLTSGIAGGAATPLVRAVPASSTVALDSGNFEVQIQISDFTEPAGLGGYDLYLTYNPNVIQAVRVVDSGLVHENNENIIVCVPAEIDNGEGAAILSCAIVPIFTEDGPIVTSPRLLASATFKPVGAGTSQIDLTGTITTDTAGAIIPTNLQGAQIAVVAAQPAPTSTAEPTAAASPASTVQPAPTATGAPAATAAPSATAPPSSTPARAVASATLSPSPLPPGTGSPVDTSSGSGRRMPLILALFAATIAVAGAVAGLRMWRARRRSEP